MALSAKNKLCCAFEKYVAVKTTEINEKTENVTLDLSSYRNTQTDRDMVSKYILNLSIKFMTFHLSYNTFLAQVLYNL